MPDGVKANLDNVSVASGDTQYEDCEVGSAGARSIVDLAHSVLSGTGEDYQDDDFDQSFMTANGDGGVDLAGVRADDNQESVADKMGRWFNHATNAFGQAVFPVTRATLLQNLDTQKSVDYLEEATGSHDFSDFLKSLAPQISSTALSKGKAASIDAKNMQPTTNWGHLFKLFAAKNNLLENLLDKHPEDVRSLIEFMLLKVGHNFVKAAVESKFVVPEDDPDVVAGDGEAVDEDEPAVLAGDGEVVDEDEPAVLAGDGEAVDEDDPDVVADTLAFVMAFIVKELKKIEGELKKIEAQGGDDQEARMKEAVKGVVDRLVQIALPEKENEIPVRNVVMLIQTRSFLWNLIIDSVFPPLVLKVYHYTTDPKRKFEATADGCDKSVKELSDEIAFHVKKATPDLLAAGSHGVTAQVHDFFGIDGGLNWLSSRLQNVFKSPSLESVLHYNKEYLSALIQHVIISLGKGKEGVLSAFTYKLLEIVNAFIQKNGKAIEEKDGKFRAEIDVIAKEVGKTRKEVMEDLAHFNDEQLLGRWSIENQDVKERVANRLADARTSEAQASTIADELGKTKDEVMEDLAHFNDEQLLGRWSIENQDAKGRVTNALTQARALQNQILVDFRKLGIDLLVDANVFEECEIYCPDVYKDLLPTFFLQCYRDMTWSEVERSVYTKALAKVFGKEEIPEGVDKPVDQLVRDGEIDFRNRLIDKMVAQLEKSSAGSIKLIKESLRTYFLKNPEAVSDLLQDILPGKASSDALKGLVPKLLESNEAGVLALSGYIEREVSLVLFKLFARQAHLAKKEKPGLSVDLLPSQVVIRLLTLAKKHLADDAPLAPFYRVRKDIRGVLEKYDLSSLRDVYLKLEQQIGDDKEMRLLQELLALRFTPFARELFKDLLEDPESELLHAVPVVLREQLFPLIQEQILPAFFADFYGKVKAWDFKKEQAKDELNDVLITTAGEDHNHISGFCLHLAKLCAASISHSVVMKKEGIGEKVYGLYLKQCFQGFDRRDEIPAVIARNVEHLAKSNDSAAKWGKEQVEGYLESALLQLFTKLAKSLSDQEFPDGKKKSQRVISELIEGLLHAAKDHFGMVNEVTSKTRVWRLNDQVMKKGFQDKGLLHPALKGEKEKEAYFKQLSKKLMGFIGVDENEFPIPDEGARHEAFKGLQDVLFPTLLSQLFDSIVSPHTLNVMLNNILTSESEITKSLNVMQYLQLLKSLKGFAQTDVLRVLEREGNWADVERVINQIYSRQSELYHHNTDDRLVLVGYLRDIKDQLLKLQPHKPHAKATAEEIAALKKEAKAVREQVLKEVRKIVGDETTGLVQFLTARLKANEAEEITDEDANDPFIRACGELFLNLSKHVPMLESVFKLGVIRKKAGDKAALWMGKAIRKEMKKLTLLQLINLGAEEGTPGLVQGDWFGRNGHRQFIPGIWGPLKDGEKADPGSDFYKGNLKFTPAEAKFSFFKSDEERKKFEKDKEAKTAELRKANEELIIERINQAVKDNVSAYFNSQWEKIQDLWMVRAILGPKVIEKKEGNFARKVVELFWKVFDIASHPIIACFFALLNLYVRYWVARPLVYEKERPIHANLVYKAPDILTRAIKV